MTFGAPQYLYALIALPALAVFVWWAFSQRNASVRRIGDPALIERLSMSVNRGMRRRRLVLWFVGIALIIIALARPQWGSDVQIVEHRGVQVMVALDISRSMLAQDLKPTRLDRAKLEISEMMSRLTGDEVGIVLFSGASFIQFPLTFDYATARTYLRNANPDIISRQGTVIDNAIETAMTGFNEERVSQKIIVIMTDGENHEGDPIGAARQAVEEGAVIYTVGFGSPEGEPIPVNTTRRATLPDTVRTTRGVSSSPAWTRPRFRRSRGREGAGISARRSAEPSRASWTRFSRSRTRALRASSTASRSSASRSSCSRAYSRSCSPR